MVLRLHFQKLHTSSPAGINNDSIVLYNEVRKFYALHAFRPAWTSFNHLNRNGEKLIGLIENAREYGLEPVHYHINKLREIQLQIEDDRNRSKHGQNRMELEMLLTDAALKFMVNLHGGYRAYDSTLLSSGWISALPALLLQGIKMGNPVEQILSVQPRLY